MAGRYQNIAVYIMASRRNGTIYIGVTSNLGARAHQHKQGLVEGFTRRYGCKLLVWYESHASMVEAIQRERTMKHWPRKWKLRLIEETNPEWDDLSAGWFD